MSMENCHAPEWTCDDSYDCPPKSLPSCLSLLLLPPRLLAASFFGASDVIKKTLDGAYADDCSQIKACCESKQDCCEIPETQCPSPIVCRINWIGCPGDTLKYQIQVTNISKQKRDFTLTPQAFPCTDDLIKVVPNKQSLAPDESLSAVSSFTIPDAFGGGR